MRQVGGEWRSFGKDIRGWEWAIEGNIVRGMTSERVDEGSGGSRRAGEGQEMQVRCENAKESSIKLEEGNRECGNANKC